MSDFIKRLEQKVIKQLSGQKVGYLVGAGASYLNGNGYPLATELWNKICDDIPDDERKDIQEKLDEGADGLEVALDLLDDGGVNETPHRYQVVSAIAKHFCNLNPKFENHAHFLKRISQRTDEVVPIFTLNYDPLFERAAEFIRIPLIDGFTGIEHAFYDPILFQQRIGVIRRSWRGRRFSPTQNRVHLYKLHGSLGWYEGQLNDVRRCGFANEQPPETRRLMIPPQRRKATDTMAVPYSSLWTEFRAFLRHGPCLINRLVAIGYGMRDEHVNDVIDNGLARNNLTLIIFAYELQDDVFERWSQKDNAIIVTSRKCSLYGEQGEAHPDLWSFERLSREI